MERLSGEAAQLYGAGDYTNAAKTFLEAYEAQPHPNLLKNAAVAWFKAGRCTEAVRWSATYAEKAQDAGVLDQTDLADLKVIRAKCAILEARSALAGGDVELAREALQSVPRDVDHEETLDLYAEVQADIVAVQVQHRSRQFAGLHPPRADGETLRDDLEVESDRASSAWPYVGWTAVGLGTAALATQAILAYSVSGDVATVREFQREFGCREGEDGSTTCDMSPPDDVRDEWASAETRVRRFEGTLETVMIASGGAFIGIGAAVLIGHYLSSNSTVAVAPALGEGELGAVFQYRF